jgi:hypothetical protein
MLSVYSLPLPSSDDVTNVYGQNNVYLFSICPSFYIYHYILKQCGASAIIDFEFFSARTSLAEDLIFHLFCDSAGALLLTSRVLMSHYFYRSTAMESLEKRLAAARAETDYDTMEVVQKTIDALQSRFQHDVSNSRWCAVCASVRVRISAVAVFCCVVMILLCCSE